MNQAELQEALDRQTAPRVTREDMLKHIVKADYVIMPDGRTTICSLELDNGFTVRGESSCVSKENFNADIGATYAYDDAFNKLWVLFGFLLAEDLYRLRVQAHEHDLLTVVGDQSGN